MTNIDWHIDKAERQDYTLKSIRTDGQGSEDPFYLKEKVADALILGLGDVVKKMPHDPIEHLAHFLYKYRKIKLIEVQDDEEKISLRIEQAQYEKELALKSLRLQEQGKIEEIDRKKEVERIGILREELDYALQERQRQISEQMQSEFERIQRLKHESLQGTNDQQLLENLLRYGTDIQHLGIVIPEDQRSMEEIHGEKDKKRIESMEEDLSGATQDHMKNIHEYINNMVAGEQKRLRYEMEMNRMLEEEFAEESSGRQRGRDVEMKKLKEIEYEIKMDRQSDMEKIRKSKEDLKDISLERKRDIEEQMLFELERQHCDRDRQAEMKRGKDGSQTSSEADRLGVAVAPIKEDSGMIPPNVPQSDSLCRSSNNGRTRRFSTFTKSKSL